MQVQSLPLHQRSLLPCHHLEYIVLFHCHPPMSLNLVGSYLLKSTYGQPPKKYELLLSAKVKYLIVNYVSTHRLFKPYVVFVNQLSVVSLPSKVHDAIKEEKWAKAMEIEMDALKKNGTWDLVPLPPGKETVGCR